MLIGRDDEIQALHGLLDAARSGRGAGVLIEGEPGIGKSALAADAEQYARDASFLVLGAQGTRGGGGVGHSSLHELLLPILSARRALPPRQRAAIEIVFGQAEGIAPEPLIVNIAVLGLLEEAAARRPLLLVLEDLHWLDRSTLEVVDFIGPRLGALPVMLLATTRPMQRQLSFRTRIGLSGLAREDAIRLVSTHRPDASATDLDRIVDTSVGNPLALTEFSVQRASAVSARPRTHLPLSRRLEEVFLSDVTALPDNTRRALLVAAAGEDASTGELGAALARAGHSLDDLLPAERAGLLRVHAESFAFRHPLVSSALYDAADAAARSEAHRALSDVVHDAGRSAQHLAAATVGWDETVAARLDEVAATAMARGARSEATASWLSAASLSEQPDRRGARLAAAAEAARQSGDVTHAGEIAQQARAFARTPETVRQLAATEWMLSQTAYYPAGRSAAELVDIALNLDERDSRAEVLVFAAVRCYIVQDAADVALRIGDELRRVDNGEDPLVEIGLGLVVAGRRVDIARALEAFRGPLRPVDAVLLNCLAFAAEEARDIDGAELVWTRARDAFHAAGRTGDEATALCGRASVRLLQGAVGAGMADAAQALRLSDDLGLNIVGAMASAVVARARAMRGEYELHREAVADTHERGGPEMFARVAATLSWAEAIAAGNEGRAPDAVAAFEQTEQNPPIALWAMADLVEHVARTPAAQLLDDWLTHAEDEAEASGSSHLRLLTLRTRALLSRDDAADDLFAQAIAVGADAHASVDLARTHLYYGEWLRRARHITRAREHLRRALPTFQRENLQPLVQRTVGELRAAGDSAGGAAPNRADAAGILTGQELQIAQMAAAGMTNKEIADHVYLSHRTVGAHLHRAFAKLGISRRAQLSGVVQH